MCYRTRKQTVCRCVGASFSPEILQAGAVKGLTLLFRWWLTVFSDTVFVTFFHAPTETASSTQVDWHWRGPHLLNIVVPAVADGLFGLCGSEHWDEPLVGTRSPPFTNP